MTANGRVVAFGPGEGAEHRLGADRFVTKGDVTHRSEGFAVVEYQGAPGVEGPPLHVHRSFEEAWYILEGQVTFHSEGRTVDAIEGSYLYVPRNVPHTFRVAGTRPARWIGIFSPGKYVGLIEELGPLMPPDRPPDLAEVVRLFARYDSEMVQVPDRTRSRRQVQ